MPIKPGTNATIRGEAIEMVNNGVEVNGGHSLVLVLLLLLLLLLRGPFEKKKKKKEKKKNFCPPSSFSSPFFEYTVCESIMETAVRNGDAKKVAELIREDPGFNVTMAVDGNEWTLLHVACF